MMQIDVALVLSCFSVIYPQQIDIAPVVSCFSVVYSQPLYAILKNYARLSGCLLGKFLAAEISNYPVCNTCIKYLIDHAGCMLIGCLKLIEILRCWNFAFIDILTAIVYKT